MTFVATWSIERTEHLLKLLDLFRLQIQVLGCLLANLRTELLLLVLNVVTRHNWSLGLDGRGAFPIHPQLLPQLRERIRLVHFLLQVFTLLRFTIETSSILFLMKSTDPIVLEP